MSLLNLVHKSVVIKFSSSAGPTYQPDTPYVFRLSGVDAMGFLLLQDLKPGGDASHEVASDPYWINKDLVREIHELDLARHKGPLHYAPGHAKAKSAKSTEPAKPAAPKVTKAKAPKTPTP